MMRQLIDGLEAGDPTTTLAAMAPDVTLRVAVHDQPFHGIETTSAILGAVLDGPLSKIRITETIGGPDATVLLFTAQVAHHPAPGDGLLVVRTDGQGYVADLTVFLRPLSALQALADEMGRRLGGPMPDAD